MDGHAYADEHDDREEGDDIGDDLEHAARGHVCIRSHGYIVDPHAPIR
jgi:hypothetical protein